MSTSTPEPLQQPQPLERAEFDAAELVRAHPPQMLHPNKAVVRAARAESVRIADTDAPSSRRVLVHTGFWGCGAFGGNRTLMPILQALAADLAGVDIAFHAFDGAGVATAREAVDEYRRIRDTAADTAAIVDAIVDRGFEWGVSDGN